MKLSKQTISIFNNFCSISPQLRIFENNNTIVSKSLSKDILGIATIDETFPIELNFYDLSKFLKAISLISDPQLEFGENDPNTIYIKGGGNNKEVIKFINSFPQQYLNENVSSNIPKLHYVISFIFPYSLIEQLKRVSHTMGFQSVILKCNKESNEINISLSNSSIAYSGNSYSFEIPITTNELKGDAEIILDIGRFNIPHSKIDYSVEISDKKIMKISSLDKDYRLEYYMTTHVNSFISSAGE